MGSNGHTDPALFGFLSMIHGILMPPRQTLKLVTSHLAAGLGHLGVQPTPDSFPSLWVSVLLHLQCY